MTSKQYKGLPAVPTGKYVDETISFIEDEMNGVQTGLFSRWHRVNKSVERLFRYRRIITIAGRSGSCKSYILNMLRSDFLDVDNTEYKTTTNFYIDEEPIYLPDKSSYYKDANLLVKDGVPFRYGLNKNINKKPIIIHFGFEMHPVDELIRTSSNVLGLSYGYLLSSNEDAEGKQIVLSSSEFTTVKDILTQMKTRKEYYINITGNTAQMQATVDAIVDANPGCGIVITIDHTLLPLGDDDARIVEDTSRFAIYNKQKYDALVILTHQFNNEIEGVDRRRTKSEHYPRIPDLYYINKIRYASDIIVTAHRPELLDIKKYGEHQLNTTNLLHWQVLKGRNMANGGHVWLEADLSHGRIYERNREYFL